MIDLRAAAERLLTDKSADYWLAIDRLPDAWEDVEPLARHILATHAADDGEAISYEWWHSAVANENGVIFIRDNLELGLYSETVFLQVYRSNVFMPHITTRGQLRRLVAALRGEG